MLVRGLPRGLESVRVCPCRVDECGAAWRTPQVLLALQRLVNVLGLESPSLYQLLLPLLAYATDPTQPEALHLVRPVIFPAQPSSFPAPFALQRLCTSSTRFGSRKGTRTAAEATHFSEACTMQGRALLACAHAQLEDGLGLYLVTLRNAPALRPELLAPLPHVAAALAQSTEHIAVCMAILTSAALLARDQLASHAHVSAWNGLRGGARAAATPARHPHGEQVEASDGGAAPCGKAPVLPLLQDPAVSVIARRWWGHVRRRRVPCGCCPPACVRRST